METLYKESQVYSIFGLMLMGYRPLINQYYSQTKEKSS